MQITEALIFIIVYLLLFGIGLAIALTAVTAGYAIVGLLRGQNIREAIKPLTDQW